MDDIQNSDTTVMFNAWKHHRNHIISRITSVSSTALGRQEIMQGLAVIGNSVADLYLGHLSPDEICSEIISMLKTGGNYEPGHYSPWLSQNKGYRMVSLSDASRWTLRLGNDESRYIHIHPGRYSPNTIRIKALTLKTIVVTVYWCRIKNEKANLGIINQARLELLNEPPLKDAGSIAGIARAFKIITGEELF
jgi:hypothetical protein